MKRQPRAIASLSVARLSREGAVQYRAFVFTYFYFFYAYLRAGGL
jgi:hypothetical protein